MCYHAAPPGASVHVQRRELRSLQSFTRALSSAHTRSGIKYYWSRTGEGGVDEMSDIDLDATLNAIEQGTLPDWIAEHLRVYQESGGEEGHLWDSTTAGGKGLLPCLLLHTTGRRSGRRFVHPLIYGVDGEHFVIVGSKGGAETQPGWYFNLIEEPQTTIQVGPDEIRVRARILEGDERERLWMQMVDVFPPYRDYQAKTSRQIPLFLLERVAV